MRRYVGVTVDGVEFTILREIALEICRIDDDMGQVTGCPSDSFMNRAQR